MSDGKYQIKSGREIMFQQLHIHVTGKGYLEGRAEWIHSDFMAKLPHTVRWLCGRHIRYRLLKDPPCPLQKYLFIVELISYLPVNDGNDFSELALLWFDDSLPVGLDAYIAEKIHDIDWNKHASDGNF